MAARYIHIVLSFNARGFFQVFTTTSWGKLKRCGRHRKYYTYFIPRARGRMYPQPGSSSSGSLASV